MSVQPPSSCFFCRHRSEMLMGPSVRASLLREHPEFQQGLCERHAAHESCLLCQFSVEERTLLADRLNLHRFVDAMCEAHVAQVFAVHARYLEFCAAHARRP